MKLGKYLEKQGNAKLKLHKAWHSQAYSKIKSWAKKCKNWVKPGKNQTKLGSVRPITGLTLGQEV
jgi:hypothetical protein